MITEKNIQIDDNTYHSKAEALSVISDFISKKTGITTSDLMEGFQERELESNTAIGDEIAIPHAILSKINQSYVFFHIFEKGVDWQAFDKQKVRIVFSLVIAKSEHNNQHIRKLSSIATSLMDEDVQKFLKHNRNKKALCKKINEMEEKL